MSTLLAVCTNKPRASTATAKGNQWWRREVWHIAHSGITTKCGLDRSEYLTIGPISETEAAADRNLCTRCARKAGIQKAPAPGGSDA